MPKQRRPKANHFEKLLTHLIKRKGLKLVGKLANGKKLYVEETRYGRRYISDEIAEGVIVWETTLVSANMLKMAIRKEEKVT